MRTARVERSGSVVLVTGGARSGKSAFAERYAAHLAAESLAERERQRRGRGSEAIVGDGSADGDVVRSGDGQSIVAHPGGSGRIVYVATSQPRDREMAERVALHRARRPAGWQTVEEPLDVVAVLARFAGLPEAERPAAALVDCVTVWLSNWLLAPGADGAERWADAAWQREVENEADRLARTVAVLPFPIVLVTNEVGDGIVPPSPLGRIFRDVAGRVNQRLAACADEVFLVTCGIPVNVRALAWTPPRREGE